MSERTPAPRIGERLGGHVRAQVVGYLALFVALGGTGAWAADKITSKDIAKNAVKTPKIANGAVNADKLADGSVLTQKLSDGAVTERKLEDNAVTSEKVKDFGLRLHDLGGKANEGTSTVGATINVPPGGCTGAGVASFNPAPRGVIGSLVVGFLTDAQGAAVLDNVGVVLPTMISETSQGGAIANLMVCDFGSGQTVPAGSVFHYQLIGP